MSNQEYIKIEGAYENNLKHISLDIPKKQITIFTGVSGSGRSPVSCSNTCPNMAVRM